MFHKASAYIRIGLKDILAYKFEVAIWILITPITLAVYYFLWHSIYAYSGEAIIRGFTFSELISYFILAQIAGMFTFTNMDQSISDRIRQGTLVIKLIRPISLFRSILLTELGQYAFVFAVQTIPLLAIGAIFFGLSFAGWITLTLAVISFALAIVLNLTFVFFLGLSSFWVTRYHGIRQVRNGLTWFLGGGIMPLAFFPQFWQQVFNFLPFKYMISAPIQVYLGKIDALTTLGLQASWIVLFYLLIQIIWPKAMARFSAVGG